MDKIQTEHLTVNIKDITRDDMPSEFLTEVYDLCGKDVALSLMVHQKGVNVFIPSRPFLKLERRLLVDEFDGTSASLRRIARKYSMSEGVIRQILKKASRTPLPADGQIGLFDEEES